VRISIALAVLAGCSSRHDTAPPPNPPAPAVHAAPPAATGDAKLASLRGVTPIVEAAFGSRTGLVWGPRLVAWVERDAAGMHVVANGRAARTFDKIEDLELARDGALAYVGFDRAGAHVVHGDDVGPAFEAALILDNVDWIDPPFVYIGRRGFAERLVVANTAGPEVTSIDITRLEWLPGHQPAYEAQLGSTRHVVIGTELGPAYTSLGYLQVAGGRVGYSATDATGSYAFVGRAAGLRYDEVNDLRIGPSGLVGYEGLRAGKLYAVVGAREEGPYDRVIDFAFAGEHYAYTARIGERWFVVVDGKRGPGFRAFHGKPVFSADGAHVAYVAYPEDDHSGPERLVRDGRVDPREWEDIEFPTWSDDGAHLAYEARATDGKYRVVVDGVPGEPFESVGSAQFGADGRVHYEARRTRDWCVVSGAAPACYADVGEPNMIAADKPLNFILDRTGAHVAFRARVERGWTVVIDGKPGPVADQVWPPTFSEDGTLVSWGDRSGDDLWWRVARVAN
jgi:hypothetical protein